MSHDHATEPRDWTARALVAAALALVLLTLVPIANRIPGGFATDWYDLQLSEWGFGALLCGGLGALLAIVSRRAGRPWVALDPGALDRHADRHWTAWVAALTVAAFALYTAVAWSIFGGQSGLIDEMAQTLHARTIARGAVVAPLPRPLEFFAVQHMLYVDGHAASQYPIGGPANIALAELLGAGWLGGPLFGALSVLLFAAWVRRTEASPAAALLAVALFTLAPFTMFMAGTRMNHVATTTLVLGASVALLAVVRADRPRPALALLCGLCYGAAATFRPIDAAAFALPGAAWLVLLAARDRRRVADLLVSGVGVALPIAVMLASNAAVTGHPLTFGYSRLWGPSHDLGFHAAPWGEPHTPVRGLELLNVYFLLLQRSFLETPLPALAGVIGAWLLVRRTTGADRYLLASSLLVVLAYFAYWHGGKHLGPRFMHPLLPLCAVWTARFPGLLRERLTRADAGRTDGVAGGLAWRFAVFTMLVTVAVAAAYSIPLRWEQYRRTFALYRWNPDRAARAAGARNALVLVQDGWESQLMVRLWTLGIEHTPAERYYRSIDACRLDQQLTLLEQAGAPPSQVARALDGLVADSSLVQGVQLPSGFKLRVQVGYPYSPRCQRRVQEAIRGTVPLQPILAAARDTSVVYARDLQARDTLLVARYPGRPIWLVLPTDGTPEALPALVRANVDSLRRAWAMEADAVRGERESIGTGVPLLRQEQAQPPSGPDRP